MGHAVENGVIKQLSVSQIEKFAAGASPWSCERRWWFRYVAGLEEPATGPQEAGKQLHSQIEHYLKTGQDVLGPLANTGRAWIPTPGPDLLVEYELPRGELTARGIPFVGQIDLLNLRAEIPEIVDWKTTSKLRYAKTEEQLRRSIQLNGYARWFFGRSKGDRLRLSLVYFQTSTPGNKRITCTVDRETVTYEWQKVEAIVGRMQDAAKEPDLEKIEPNRKACFVAGKPCPFLSRCPGGNPLASLLDKFGAAPEAPAPVVQVPTGVLPPDAPKSDPALAADPIDDIVPPPRPRAPLIDLKTAPIAPATQADLERAAKHAAQPPIDNAHVAPGAKPFTPEEIAMNAPKKRGRPSKADLAARAAVQAPAQSTLGPASVGFSKPDEEFALRVHTISIRHEAKIGLPNFSSAGVSVELTAEAVGNIESALKALCEQVDQELRREVAPLKPAPAA